MTDEFERTIPRPREAPRDTLYKRRGAGVESIGDESAMAASDYFDVGEPIDDTSVDIFYLVDRLEELVSIGKRVPVSGKVMVEENDFLALVDQLRIAVPNEIKHAQRVIRERQHIIAESHEEAARILDAARKRAEYFVSQEGILNEARLQGEKMLQDAQDRRNRVLGEIDVYALEQFDRVEGAMRDGLRTIEDALSDAAILMDEAKRSVGQ
jgi:F0F1-type ATP synthase membrane subunit b/b'